MNNEAVKVKSVREPLFHVVKRTEIVWWKAWLIRAAAIVAALVATGLLSFIRFEKESVFCLFVYIFRHFRFQSSNFNVFAEYGDIVADFSCSNTGV